MLSPLVVRGMRVGMAAAVGWSALAVGTGWTAADAGAASVRTTALTGFNLPSRLPAASSEREAFRVSGPSSRRFALQFRAPGGSWTTADWSRAVRGRGHVRIRVRRDGDSWLWGVHSDGSWTFPVTTTTTHMDWRIKLPAAGRYSRAFSRVERTWAHQPSTAPAAPGTSVRPEQAQQVLVANRTSGVHGTYRRYEWTPAEGRWVRVGSSDAFFGYGGVISASKRVQGSGKTPAGTFRLLHAFGGGSPGTQMPYRQVTKCSNWVLASGASDYNRWRESCTSPPRAGEHLQTYVRRELYRHAVVTDYNYYNRTRRGAGSGGAIFLHYDTKPTSGCVGITSMDELTRTVQWLDPAKAPVIVIKR